MTRHYLLLTAHHEPLLVTTNYLLRTTYWLLLTAHHDTKEVLTLLVVDDLDRADRPGQAAVRVRGEAGAARGL